MSASANATHRVRVLHALGLTPWVRRVAVASSAVVGPVAAEPVAEGIDGACVVVLPASCSTRQLDLLGRALLAAGAALARSPRITVQDGQLTAEVPVARAYLVFGETRRACALAGPCRRR
ncbi:hypothetical protein [Rhodanobacter lindaniclasticus]